MNRSENATAQDRIEVGGLAVLLHPDSQPGQLDLTLRCNGNSYTATIQDIGDGWALLLEDIQTGHCRRELDATQEAAIVSAILSSLDATWLQAGNGD